jgi:enoyl-CoA hydratase/carnithine racemase
MVAKQNCLTSDSEEFVPVRPAVPFAACQSGTRGAVLLEAQELIFTARRVGGGEAQKLGLVDHCVDAGRAMDRALELARDISQVCAGLQNSLWRAQAVSTFCSQTCSQRILWGTLGCTQATRPPAAS